MALAAEITGDDYDIDFDGTSVWVQVGGECIARFGKAAHEVYGVATPRQPVLLRAGATVDDWKAFERAVLDVHGYVIPRSATPRRFHVELGIAPIDHDGDYLLPVAVLIRNLHDPFVVDVWGRSRVTLNGVRDAISHCDLEPKFVSMDIRDAQVPGWDMRRIAYLVTHPDDTPIVINVLNEEGDFELIDGYHRLAAAIYRGDLNIAISLSGYVLGYDTHFADRIPIEAPTYEFEEPLGMRP